MTVRVYNCAGALVRTLAEGNAVQRSLTLTWDGTDERGKRVAGGVYFLRIDSRTLTRTVKLILIR
jgi:flagellar hook assembly protein FlgD